MASTKKDDHAKAVNEQIEIAESNTLNLTGYTRIVRLLDIAFVHALAGAEKDVKEAVDAAEAEIAKFAPALSHLQSEIAILKARVFAALGLK